MDKRDSKNTHRKDVIEEFPTEISSGFEVLSSAVRVHDRKHLLDEDTTLANLSAKFPPLAEWVSRNVHTLGILKEFMKVDINITEYSNELKTWGTEKVHKKPFNKEFRRIENLMMNHVKARLITSRAIKGAPLKSFLTYGRDVTDKPLVEEKQSTRDRLLGRPPEEEGGL